MRRNVYIRHEPEHRALLVVYADERKAGKRLYAQFDDRRKSMDDVIKYVRENQEVRLVCAISGTPI